jgi:heme exporter protein A
MTISRWYCTCLALNSVIWFSFASGFGLFNASLTASNVSASRGGFTLFERVSFDLKNGEALRVTGPNGTGKTTLLRCLAGLVRTDAGIVSNSAANTIHYLGHLNGMKPQLTVAENLRFWAAFDNGGNFDSTNLDTGMKTMNLPRLKNLQFSVLSSGQKRRVALARLSLSQRPVWLLDEPTVGLDSASVTLVETLLATHLNQGGIIVAATHTPLGNANWQTLELQPVQP